MTPSQPTRNEGRKLKRELPLLSIVHISDLHFGEDFTADEDLLAKMAKKVPYLAGLLPHSYQASRALALRVNQILRDRCDARVCTVIAFTGDLTCSGAEAEFVVGNTFLRSAHSLGAGDHVGLGLGEELPPTLTPTSHPVLFPIPGNHDIWKRKNPKLLGVYRRTFPNSYPVRLEIQTRGPKILLYGLDSTLNSPGRHKLARGQVPTKDLEILEQYLLEGANQGAIQIVCIHHTLRDSSGSVLDPTMALENREPLGRKLFEAGANLVLAGHIHEWFVEPQVRGTFPAHITIGTATQQCSDRSFALLDIFETSIRAGIFEFEHGTREFVRKDVSWDLPITPYSQAVRA